MKILVINWQDIANPKGGGAEVHLHNIFKKIAAKGNEVTLFCSAFNDAPDNDNIDGINIIRRGKRNTFNYIVPGYYKKHFRNKGYDIIIDDINKIPFFTPLFVKEKLLAISHHFFGTSIYRETNPIFGTYVLAAEKLVDFIYKKTPFAVVSQSTLDEFISRGFNPSMFDIVPNAIEQKEYPMRVSEKNPYHTITYFGRLKRYKSIDHILYAFSKVKDEYPRAQLELIGTGDYRPNLERLAAGLNIAEQTTFYGFVSDSKKIELLSKSHCVVNTSLKEGWGITNIESNACGTLVISANVPGLKDSVKPNVSGLLYEYGNVEELSEYIKSILRSEDLLYKLSEGAVSWASEFSWDSSAQKMLSICDRIIHSY